MARLFEYTLISVGSALIFTGAMGLYGHWFTDVEMTPTVFEVAYWMVAGGFGVVVGIAIRRNA